ncbi:MAG: mobilization protein [Planctomycetes bacterium]|nr:mobilization protein [Planctomycetota bacterium]
MSSIHFIGGEKGGVGKSVVARLVAQYLIDHNRPFLGYDTDRSHGSFARFYADYASPVLVDSFASIDRIVEALIADPAKPALVDLAAQTLRPLKEWTDASGMAELLAEHGHGAVFWHVLDDSKDSLTTLDDLFAAFGDGVSYVIVLNHGRGSSFALFHGSPQEARAVELGARIIQLPRLHEASMRKIDRFDTSFWAAINRTDGEAALGLLERQRVKMWLRKAYQEIEAALQRDAAG